ncbi:MAG: lipid-A-disaccharide synthase [Desulfobacterales bacterium]
MSSDTSQQCVMIIAGEASGDLHGAKVVRAMNDAGGPIFFCGIGGEAMAAAGVRILVDASDLAVVGITEAVAKAGALLGGLATARGALKTLHPDLLILIDFPDFNLQVARAAKKRGIPVLYYISPQIWAWRQGRVKKMKKLVDHMAVILPFEASFFEKADIPVSFVGHPLLDIPTEAQADRKEDQDPRQEGPIVGLLPGSRNGEIRRHLPEMLASARILSGRMPGVKFILSAAPAMDERFLETTCSDHAGEVDIDIETGDVTRIFNRCALVVAASGTVTLEAAIAGVPMVVIYRISSFSGHLVRALIRVKYVCLANLIADKEIVPELLQQDASAENIADKVFTLISDVSELDRMRSELLDLRQLLGGPGASRRVADIALGMMRDKA